VIGAMLEQGELSDTLAFLPLFFSPLNANSLVAQTAQSDARRTEDSDVFAKSSMMRQ